MKTQVHLDLITREWVVYTVFCLFKLRLKGFQHYEDAYKWARARGME